MENLNYQTVQSKPSLEEYMETIKEQMEEQENKILQMDISPLFTCVDEEGWTKYVDANTDGYGRAVLVFANFWARNMEELIDKEFNLTDEQINKCSDKADEIAGGITGFMYGCSISILKQVWKYGNDLNRWHNKQYGKEDTEGTINPAVITIGE